VRGEIFVDIRVFHRYVRYDADPDADFGFQTGALGQLRSIYAASLASDGLYVSAVRRTDIFCAITQRVNRNFGH
jgi:hypothetical protein